VDEVVVKGKDEDDVEDKVEREDERGVDEADEGAT
jgi:hypothetical protein